MYIQTQRNDVDWTTPLECAVCLGCEEIVEILLKHGADPTFTNPLVNKSALDVALEAGNASMARLLLGDNCTRHICHAENDSTESSRHDWKRQRTE